MTNLIRRIGTSFLLLAITGAVASLTGAGIAATAAAEQYNLKKVAGQMADSAYLKILDSRIKTGEQLFKYGGVTFLGGASVTSLTLLAKKRRNYKGR